MSANFSRYMRTEQVIRRFYHHFTSEKRIFLTTLQQDGHFDPALDIEHFVTTLFHRLMVLYFLQKQGLFHNDPDYLQHLLHNEATQNLFYARHLRPLLDNLLSTLQREQPPHTHMDLSYFTEHNGHVPAATETVQPSLLIPDRAFARLFDFFATYHWSLDEVVSNRKDTITPDVLGSIFEQYVNQQQMGAYYTRDDVTDYIAHNTLIPTLFDLFAQRHPTVFGPDGTVWAILKAQPELYIQDGPAQQQEQEWSERAQAHQTLYDYISQGHICSIDACITHNISLLKFACDALSAQTDVDMLRDCYQCLQTLTVLDPTCGSGAFLFAALRTLQPLYAVCISSLDILQGQCQTNRHTNMSRSRYRLIEHIIANNLFGVDLMPDATEICRLRLYLKLMQHYEPTTGSNTLPPLRHNILSGNALVEIKAHAVQWEPFAGQAQTLAQKTMPSWEDAFPEVIARGGFDCIIGNPPYVEFTEKTLPYALTGFKTRICANLYTCIIERSRALMAPWGREGMILPIAAFSTRNMQPFLECFQRWFPISWVAFFHFRPAMLFSGGKIASIPTAIYLARAHGSEQRFSTNLLKWTQAQRHLLFKRLAYQRIAIMPDMDNRHYYPKFGHAYDNAIMQKIRSHTTLHTYITPEVNTNTMYYRSAGGLYWKVFVNFAWPYVTTSNKQCSFAQEYERDVFVALFNSSLFWWYYTVTFDTFNLKDYMLFGFRFTYPQNQDIVAALCTQCELLMADYRKYARHLKRGSSDSYTIYARKSKALIDTIDTILASHYGFSEEELTYILNYDIAYRLGPDSGEPAPLDLTSQQTIEKEKPEAL